MTSGFGIGTRAVLNEAPDLAGALARLAALL